MRDLVEFIRSEKDYAILWALRQRNKYPEEMFAPVINLPHVHIVDYIPQQGVLRHPNVKIFFTHGGQGSFSDAIET